MAKRGKKYKEMIKDFDDRLYSLEDSIEMAKKTSYSKFPGSLSIHVSIKLPKDTDPKSVKGNLSLPNQIKMEEKKIAVFCEADIEEEAKKAGAVEAGLDNLIKKIQGGWMDFDIILATPSVMSKIAVLGRQLGPQGLMPNPKTGTLVNPDKIVETIGEFQKGKTKFSCDDGGVIHMLIGTTEMESAKVKENILKALEAMGDTLSKAPKQLVKSLSIAATMGAGVRISKDFLEEEAN